MHSVLFEFNSDIFAGNFKNFEDVLMKWSRDLLYVTYDDIIINSGRTQ